jgi:hypothetical protein
MYRMSEFSLSRTSQPLPFPENLLCTESFVPLLPPIGTRRLKNVSIILIWACEDNAMRCVLVSLAEAETLRRIILHDNKLNLKQVAHLCIIDSSSPVVLLTPSIQQVTQSSHPPPLSDDVPSSTFQEYLVQSHDASLCDTAIVTSLFFNCNIHFSDSDIITLINAFEHVSRDDRLFFFQSVLCCRLRDQASWDCTPLVNFFDCDSSELLREVTNTRATLVCALTREMSLVQPLFTTVRGAYEHFCDPQTGLLTASSMQSGIGCFQQNSTLLNSLSGDALSRLLQFQTDRRCHFLTWLQFNRMVSLGLLLEIAADADADEPISLIENSSNLDALMRNLDLAEKM